VAVDAAGDELVVRSGIAMKVEDHGLVKGEEADEVGIGGPVSTAEGEET
jgi:hypothetical protein